MFLQVPTFLLMISLLASNTSPQISDISESIERVIALIDDVANIFKASFSKVSKAISSILAMLGSSCGLHVLIEGLVKILYLELSYLP